MIAVEQDEARGKLVPRAVGEGEIAALQAECIEDGVMSDTAKGDYSAQIGKRFDAPDEEPAADCHLFG